jgi:hypothetical protein
LKYVNQAETGCNGWLPPQSGAPMDASNPLMAYFRAHKEGPGIWKWLHYFEAYQHHLQKFVGNEVHLGEVGIYSGGSLAMWREYLGEKSHIYGIDIEAECRVYENDHTRVFIGDQADRAFWKRFRDHVPRLDVLIDDGGHFANQQIITLEETLPYLQPGGVYICEDIHGVNNNFAAYVYSLADRLNAAVRDYDAADLACKPTPLQSAIHSVHLYPYMVVIEKADFAAKRLVAPKQGTQWQPFL